MKILLATLAYSNPDLLETCLESWIYNTPIDVDKGVLWQGRNYDMQKAIYTYEGKMNINLRRINNWGVAGGWNIILSEAFNNRDYDGVVLVGSDTYFKHGFWKDFSKNFRYFDFIESSHKFNCFFMSRKCYNVVGTFDENFYPAYTEDDDYRTRIKLSGINYQENQGDFNLLYHEGSATVRFNPILQMKSYKSYNLNKEYMHEKWGGKEDTNPKWIPHYQTPFNDPDKKLNEWALDIEKRKERLWEDIVLDGSDKRLAVLLKAFHGLGTYDYKT